MTRALKAESVETDNVRACNDRKMESPGPALIISLDFELHWGVSERVDGVSHPYTPRLHGAREVVPRLLELFERREIHATWATVGKLFANGAKDLDAFKPLVRPQYERQSVDTYRIPLGSSEASDPLHYAPSLIRKIRETKGQELACHTFCHYFCDEPGQSAQEFEADLKAAQSIASRDGVKLRSLVFPRNQVIPDYLAALPAAGLDTYRGNPPGAMYHLPEPGIQRQAIRAVRLLDSFIAVTGHHTIPWSRIAAERPFNVCASHFIRPYSQKLRFLESLRRRRVINGLKAAARRGEVFHIWWHPHNFGANLEENLQALEAILDVFDNLRERHGMQSLTMAEAADVAEKHSSVLST